MEARVEAIETQGQLRLGTFSRNVKFEDNSAGEQTNDELIYSSQLTMNVFDFNSSSDMFTLDARDKIDTYGKLEVENLRLINYNQFQIRRLAYERPWDSNRLYFKA